MDYKSIFSPQTLEKLNKQSAENLKKMLGDKSLMQTLIESQKLLDTISRIEAPHKKQLEKLAVDMIKELYPIIDSEGIKIDAKIVSGNEVNQTLDEIRINKPGGDDETKFKRLIQGFNDMNERLDPILKTAYQNKQFTDELVDKIVEEYKQFYSKNPILNYNLEHFKEWVEGIKNESLPINSSGSFYTALMDRYWLDNVAESLDIDDQVVEFLLNQPSLNESITPESRRRIINAITQGSAVRGSFAFYLFKEQLDKLDPRLVDSYGKILKSVFGVYDDPNAIAMFMAALAQGHKDAGGSSKVIMNEIRINVPGKNFQPGEIVLYFGEMHPLTKDKDRLKKDYGDGKIHYLIDDPDTGQRFYTDEKNLTRIKKSSLKENTSSGITIQARALNFPMLVHEIIKGLYEIVSLQGFKGDKASNQQVVDKVDKLENEPEDLKHGKFIYDALNNLFADSGFDTKLKEYFFSEIYQLEDEEFIELIENSINESLTSSQLQWVKSTLKQIERDVKEDDFDNTNLSEIRINTPGLKLPIAIRDYKFYDRIAPELEKMGYLWGDDYSYLKPTEVNPWKQRKFDSLDNVGNFGLTGLILTKDNKEQRPGKFLKVYGTSQKDSLK